MFATLQIGGYMTTMTDTDTLVLKQSKLFAALSEQDLQFVVRQCRRRVIPASQTIMREGEPGGSMLVIIFGEVDYHKGSKTIGHDSAGAFFGELALIAGGNARRAVSVIATADCVLLELYRDDFELIIGKFPSVGLVAMKSMADRLQQVTPTSIFKSKSGIAIAGLCIALTANLINHHLPDGLVSDFGTKIISWTVEYAAPAGAGIAMVLRNIEIATLRKKLFG